MTLSSAEESPGLVLTALPHHLDWLAGTWGAQSDTAALQAILQGITFQVASAPAPQPFLRCDSALTVATWRDHLRADTLGRAAKLDGGGLQQHNLAGRDLQQWPRDGGEPCRDRRQWIFGRLWAVDRAE